MAISWPVTSPDRAEANQTTSEAASSGEPRPERRALGGRDSPRSSIAAISVIPGIVATMRVSAVGTIALTGTSSFLHSTAQVRAIATTAPLEAEYAVCPKLARWPAGEPARRRVVEGKGGSGGVE